MSDGAIVATDASMLCEIGGCTIAAGPSVKESWGTKWACGGGDTGLPSRTLESRTGRSAFGLVFLTTESIVGPGSAGVGREFAGGVRGGQERRTRALGT